MNKLNILKAKQHRTILTKEEKVDYWIPAGVDQTRRYWKYKLFRHNLMQVWHYNLVLGIKSK